MSAAKLERGASMTITPEECTKLRKKHTLGPGGVFYAYQYKDAIEDINRLLDILEDIERTNTMPCPHCDFSSGQRGMERCSHCNGMGRVSVVPYLQTDRDQWKARADEANGKLMRLSADLAKVAKINHTLKERAETAESRMREARQAVARLISQRMNNEQKSS